MFWKLSVLLYLIVNVNGDSLRRTVRQNRVYDVNPPEEPYGPRPGNRQSQNMQNRYQKPKENVYITSSFGGTNRPSRPENVYAVRPPQNVQPQQNAYQVRPPQNVKQQQNAYQVQPSQNANQQNPSENAYQVQPSPNANQQNPSENAYQVQPSQNANQQNPSENPYQINPSENAYQINPSGNAYEINPSTYEEEESENPYAYYAQLHKNKHTSTLPPPTTTTKTPFQPNLLSGPSTPNQDIPDHIPRITIDRDSSIYSKEASGAAVLSKTDGQCDTSTTTVNGKSTCKGQLIFQENFDELNTNKWRHDVRIPGKPDHEFVVYVQSKNNSRIEDGKLIIRPTLLSEYNFNQEIVTEGYLNLKDCRLGSDSGYCSKLATNYNILPPVISSRLRTKHSFSFKYGRIDIRAKMPRGDWLYPQLWLEPKDNAYGRGYPSGRIVLGLSRGNSVLVDYSKETMGIQQLNVGCLFRTNDNSGSNHAKYIQKINEDGWNKSYHNYSVLWTPESMEFFVDEENLGSCPAPNLDGRRISPWRRGTKMAPFDEEFYISIGLAAGGISEFPDGSTTGREGVRKPWRNSGAKALLGFYDEESNWWSTWSDDSELKVDSIEVHAL